MNATHQIRSTHLSYPITITLSHAGDASPKRWAVHIPGEYDYCKYYPRPEAISRVREVLAQAARDSGREATVSLWDALCEQQRRIAKARADKRLAKALAGERVGRAALDAIIPTLRDKVSTQADQLIACVVRAVGKIGEQCRSDLSRMETGESFTGKKSRNHHLVRTTLERVEHVSDWSSALITLRTFEQFGSSRWGSGDRNYGSRGGNKYECYLVVRDSTTGEAHVLRVPPKFGNSDTQFFGRFRTASERIKAAVAWSFEMDPAAYRPQVTA
jgi:hypothetical protein